MTQINWSGEGDLTQFSPFIITKKNIGLRRASTFRIRSRHEGLGAAIPWIFYNIQHFSKQEVQKYKIKSLHA